MLASQYVKAPAKNQASLKIKGYGQFVGKLLKHRYAVVLAALVVMIGSYLLLPLIDKEFMPKADSRNFRLTSLWNREPVCKARIMRPLPSKI